MRRFAILALILATLPAAPAAAGAEQQVVGGRDATRPYPWMASLRSATGSHFCGGSLVRAQWILTAKHCVDGRNPSTFRVMLGSQRLSAPGLIHQIAEVITDPNNNSDSAVLKLKVPSTLEPIRIAELTEKGTWAPGIVATALGWGQTAFIVGSSPDQLQEVEVHVVSDTDCAIPYRDFDPVTEVCAGEVTGGKDTCQGDSGGPIMVPDATGRFIVFGTTYRGIGCAFPLFYGIYARVADTTIRTWLESVLPPESSLSIDDVSVVEGASGDGNTVAFTVTRAGTTARTVTVDFATLDGTATAGLDYEAASGTLTFAPDEQTKTISISVLGDGLAEAEEGFFVQLSGAVEAEIARALGGGTIQDDD